jgi:hypothetical protein
VVHTVSFGDGDLVVTRVDGYDEVRLAGCDLTNEVGRPELPLLVVTLAVPPGCTATGLSAVSTESTDLGGPFVPRPAQSPRILPVPGFAPPPWAPADPDPAVYRGVSPYPTDVALLTSRGNLGGNGAAGLVLHPVQFVPATGALRLHRRITVRVDYEGTAERGQALARPVAGVAASVFANGEAVSTGARSTAAARSPQHATALRGECEYVVITPAFLASSFAPLVEWKTRKGVPAAVVTTEWIASNYAGADAQERIRAFIAEARAQWGTAWVLLGGDTALVPARRAYAMTCEAGMHPDEDAIACDLYYSDLDGTWNADGDATYGETTDDVDLYPDVFVGRASVVTTADAATFVAKTLTYERTPPAGWFLDALLAAELLWTNPYTDSGIALDRIDHESIPPEYDPLTKLYESLGNETVTAVVSALNAGKSHFLHSGHAWYDCMGCGNGYLYRSQVDGLTNQTEQPLAYSIGCWPAAFDLPQICIAEHFIRNPHGGAVAFIGNSRYGWAAPGNPGYGYSERFMQEFYRALFVDGLANAGAALAAAKARFIPLAREPNVYRWHEYEVNLLGDPEMPVWTGEPAVLAVTHPAGAPAAGTVFGVAVGTGGAPVAGALVCVTDGSDVYGRAVTDVDGTASLTLEASDRESLWVTVTAPDCLPYEARVPVGAAGPALVVRSRSLDDSTGNGDGLAGPGETVSLAVTVSNEGTESANDVEGALSTTDPWVSIAQGAASFGDVPPGEDVEGTPFALSVASGCPDGHVARLSLALSSPGRGTWASIVPVTVAAPELRAEVLGTDDSGADGDGVPEPGESVSLLVGISNTGLAAARSPVVTLEAADAFLVVAGGVASVPTVPAGSSTQAVFDLEVAWDCPSPWFPALVVETETSDGFASAETLLLVVGPTGMATAFENGTEGWTSGGTGDSWHLSGYRTHSGAASWYCGSPSSHLYANGANAHLDSPQFVLAPGMQLSFWCWHEVPIYGEDGLFVEVLSRDGAVADTLDFIGSGGALDALGTIGNGWLEYTYPIDGTPGDTVAVRFRFSSNASVTAEGFHLDDLAVTCLDVAPPTAVPDETPSGAAALLGQNWPNPFAGSTAVSFALARAGRAEVTVYTTGGRLVRTLCDEPLKAGRHVVVWDGMDESGRRAAAGVYLCALRTGEERLVRKIVVAR